MGLFGKLFSKQTCSICGKEVGALSRIKLLDGNYICNDCRKNVSRLFNLSRHDLAATQKHLAYMEKANELYEKEFATLDKSKVDYCNHHGSYKIGFADDIAMFEIVTPELKKSNKRELFRYDQIESFGPYYEENAINRPEGQKRFKEYGVLIQLRCAEGPTAVDASDSEIALMHPYAIQLKLPLEHNVDRPSTGDRIFRRLNIILGGSDSKVVNTATSVASMLLGTPTATMFPPNHFSAADRAKYTKIADEAEKRALGKTLREI